MTPVELVHLALRPGEWRTAASLQAELDLRRAAVDAAISKLENASLIESRWSGGRRYVRRLRLGGYNRRADGLMPVHRDLAPHWRTIHHATAFLVEAGMTAAGACAGMAVRMGDSVTTPWS